MGVLVIGRRHPLILSTTLTIPLAGASRGGPKTAVSGSDHRGDSHVSLGPLPRPQLPSLVIHNTTCKRAFPNRSDWLPSPAADHRLQIGCEASHFWYSTGRSVKYPGT